MAPRIVYTDGACSRNPGPGGWAWIVPDEEFAAGAAPSTTNQRMELTAVLEALKTFDGPTQIVSDSTYVVNCFRDGWWKNWLARGWRNARREPVANRDVPDRDGPRVGHSLLDQAERHPNEQGVHGA